MAERGILVIYEAVRYQRGKSGQAYAKWFRRPQPRRGDTWPLEEAFLIAWRKITGSATVV
jgi:transposase-like protein